MAGPWGSRVPTETGSRWLAERSRASEGSCAGGRAPPPSALSAFHANYVAAMVEYACAARGVDAPQWTREIAPVTHPVFATGLASLRLHLLSHSPPPFRRRNLFVDTAVGGQV